MTNKQSHWHLASKAKASKFVLEQISSFEADEIDSDDVELRFEIDGRDTGTNVSIVDECAQAAAVIDGLLDELEAKDRRLSEITAPNMLLPAIDNLDENQLRQVIKTCGENYSLLHSKWEAAEKRVAELESECDKQGRHACELFDEVNAQRQQIAELVAAGILVSINGEG